MLKKIFPKVFNKSKFIKPDDYTLDLHSHLIPNIDDGVKTMEESIEILSQLQKIGFKKVITTPHIMWHRYQNTKEIILDGCAKVNQELKKRDIDIKLEASAEYYFDENFFELIEKEDLLDFGEKKYVLFEVSYTTKPFGLEQIIFKLLSKGYRPILAHPERYSFLNSNFKKYDQLKNTGVRFQLNINSLTGFYGKKPKLAAKYLSESGLVDFIGSDIHGQKYFDSFDKAIVSKEAEKLFSTNKILNDTLL